MMMRIIMMRIRRTKTPMKYLVIILGLNFFLTSVVYEFSWGFGDWVGWVLQT